MPSPTSTPTNSPRAVLSVSDLNRQARITIEERFKTVWVMGEMSNFARPRSGHWYFSLKDDNAQVRCAMFANRNRSVRMQAGDGQLVIARGRVSLYEGRGEFQVIIDHLEPAGEGALRQAFDQLKVKLDSEGLFDTDSKAKLPQFPRHCVVVTSPTGAAITDVLAVWQRRYPTLEVTIIPTVVQGEQAQGEIIEALKRARILAPDVILLTRGGGSLEDLWAFNLEPVARALAACEVPTVCAVGHEIDVTICDFVADVRAPTPSAAAELIVPEAAELRRLFSNQRRHLQQTWRAQQQIRRLRLANAAERVSSPRSIVEQASQRIDDSSGRLNRAMQNHLAMQQLRVAGQAKQLRANSPAYQLRRIAQQVHQHHARLGQAARATMHQNGTRLANLSRMLQSVSPLPTLARGYAIVTDESRAAVTSVSQLKTGQEVRAYFADGSASATIGQIDPDQQLEDR